MQFEREMLDNFTAFSEFRKRCRLELAFMLIFDVYIGHGFIITPMSTFALYVTALALWAGKILLAFFTRGRLYCALGASVCAAELLILGYERQLDIFTILLIAVSAALSILRFWRTLALDELSRLYGFPQFNGAICSAEAARVPSTAEILDAQTVAVRTNDRLQAAIRSVNEGAAVKCLKLGAVSACAALMISAHISIGSSKLEKGIQSAKEIKSISETYDGEYVKSVTAHIYAVQADSFDGSTSVVYWAQVGGECVSLEVPNELRDRFDTMARYYSRDNALALDGRVESPGEDIGFVAVVHGREHGDKQYFNTTAFERQSLDKSVTPNTEKRLEVLRVE